jgi:uncharacterized membrane protein
MTYILSGLRVPVPTRATRPREPGRPAPSTALRSPELAERMMRPRTPVPPGQAKAHLDKLKVAKLRQAALERQIAIAQQKLRSAPTATMGITLQRQVAVLVEQVKVAAAEANKEALAAVEKGAPPAAVKDVAASASSSSSVTPVIEASTAELQPDGTIVPGPDAGVVDVPVTSDPGSTAPLPAGTGEGSNTMLYVGGAAALLGAFFLLRK